jgi:hypothetical protein
METLAASSDYYNLLDGLVLIDGSPLGRLPESFTSHQTYHRSFGNVSPSPLLVVYRLKPAKPNVPRISSTLSHLIVLIWSTRYLERYRVTKYVAWHISNRKTEYLTN